MYAPANSITSRIPPTPLTPQTLLRVPPRSILIRLLVRRWDYRHPRFWMGLRLACAIWNLVLGVALLSSEHWLGPYAWLGLVALAGSARHLVAVAPLRRFIGG
jgi:hypothetical protein